MAAKMLNQLIVGCGHAVMAEAVVLAEAAGIDAARLPSASPVATPTARCCKSSTRACSSGISRRSGTRASCSRISRMVHEFGSRAERHRLPMMGEALSLYRLLVHLGHAELDTAALVKVLRAVTARTQGRIAMKLLGFSPHRRQGTASPRGTRPCLLARPDAGGATQSDCVFTFG
jgi:hypothetical protein